MKILLAGASSDLGAKVGELLLKGGHEVCGLTRSPRKRQALRDKRPRPVVGDLLDRASTRAALEEATPDAVVQVPIALPQRGRIRVRDLAATNRLRVDGRRNLLDAAVATVASPFVSESIVAIYGYGVVDGSLDEGSPTARSAPLHSLQPALNALEAQEAMVLDAARVGKTEGIVVRVGFYYGAGVASTRFIAKLLKLGVMPITRERGALPWVELSDAAAGVVAALERGRSGEIYNIVGDSSAGLTDLAHEMARQLSTRSPRELPAWVLSFGGPYVALMAHATLHVSNRKAKEELGWSPGFPTISDGVRVFADSSRSGASS